MYKYTLIPMILPLAVEDNVPSIDNLPSNENARSILLEKGDRSNRILRYLQSREIVAGNHALELTLDRPTIFLVSHTGMYVERLVAPTMELLERRIKVHEWDMSRQDL